MTFKLHKNSIQFVYFHPNGNWIVSMDFGGLLLVWSTNTGKVIAGEQWPAACRSMDIDWEAGALSLGFGSGAVQVADVPPPQYWDRQSPLPPWQPRWRRGPTPGLNVRELQLQGSEIADESTRALLLQRGAIALISSNNPFMTIHHYLAQKQLEKPATASARITDFIQLLRALHAASINVSVNNYLQQAQPFYRRHAFPRFAGQRNRYFHLRAALGRLDDVALQLDYQDYINYLSSKTQWANTEFSPIMQQHIEALRQQFKTIFAPSQHSAPRNAWE